MHTTIILLWISPQACLPCLSPPPNLPTSVCVHPFRSFIVSPFIISFFFILRSHRSIFPFIRHPIPMNERDSGLPCRRRRRRRCTDKIERIWEQEKKNKTEEKPFIDEYHTQIVRTHTLYSISYIFIVFFWVCVGCRGSLGTLLSHWLNRLVCQSDRERLLPATHTHMRNPYGLFRTKGVAREKGKKKEKRKVVLFVCMKKLKMEEKKKEDRNKRGRKMEWLVCVMLPSNIMLCTDSGSITAVAAFIDSTLLNPGKNEHTKARIQSNRNLLLYCCTCYIQYDTISIYM